METRLYSVFTLCLKALLIKRRAILVTDQCRWYMKLATSLSTLQTPCQQNWHCIDWPTDDQVPSTHGRPGPEIRRQSGSNHRESAEPGSTLAQSCRCPRDLTAHDRVNQQDNRHQQRYKLENLKHQNTDRKQPLGVWQNYGHQHRDTLSNSMHYRATQFKVLQVISRHHSV